MPKIVTCLEIDTQAESVRVSGETSLIFGIRKIGRLEDGRGENFPSTPYRKQDGYIKPGGFANTVVADFRCVFEKKPSFEEKRDLYQSSE